MTDEPTTDRELRAAGRESGDGRLTRDLRPAAGDSVSRDEATARRATANQRWAELSERRRNTILLGVFAAFVLLYPLLDRVLGWQRMGSMNPILIFMLLALGLNIVVGFAGLLDLGYAAFFAIGGYTAAFLTAPQSPLPFRTDFWIALVASFFVAAIFGVILGAPTLRLRGDYLAIVTLAFGEIVPRVFELSTEGMFGIIGSADWSNGRQGITPVDKPWLPVAGLDEITRLEIKPFYYIALFMVVVTMFINYRLRDSRLGRAWIAVREDEVAAAAMGVNLVRVKLWAYALGAAFGGFAGAFLGVYRNTVNVDQFEFGFSVFVLCMVIIGGMGNIAGVIMGAVALSMIDKFLLAELNGIPDRLGLDFDVTAISFGIFGFFLISMMLLRPEGFIPNRRRRLELHEAELEEEPAYTVRG
jgi:branched-chain amino acid transport system permease protein